MATSDSVATDGEVLVLMYLYRSHSLHLIAGAQNYRTSLHRN
jgi:hypothetical protein